mmetsp:Transcript_95790/g.256005  ORF Transcript_95790/g.256005 Transcript_95790/m.256005 type:complete len:211 (+) Transcript_95790:334-966(+)
MLTRAWRCADFSTATCSCASSLKNSPFAPTSTQQFRTSSSSMANSRRKSSCSSWKTLISWDNKVISFDRAGPTRRRKPPTNSSWESDWLPSSSSTSNHCINSTSLASIPKELSLINSSSSLIRLVNSSLSSIPDLSSSMTLKSRTSLRIIASCSSCQARSLCPVSACSPSIMLVATMPLIQAIIVQLDKIMYRMKKASINGNLISTVSET